MRYTDRQLAAILALPNEFAGPQVPQPLRMLRQHHAAIAATNPELIITEQPTPELVAERERLATAEDVPASTGKHARS